MVSWCQCCAAETDGQLVSVLQKQSVGVTAAETDGQLVSVLQKQMVSWCQCRRISEVKLKASGTQPSLLHSHAAPLLDNCFETEQKQQQTLTVY